MRCSPTSASDLDEPGGEVRWVGAFVALHVLVWTLVPWLTQPNAPLDVVEMHWWGEAWQAGYAKHPPAPAWLVAAVVRTGAGVPGVYLLSQLCVAVCFGSVWVLARRWLPRRAAGVAVLLLESICFVNYPTPEFNHNVLLMAVWALTVLACWRAQETGRARDWVVFGLTLAAGVWTKYSHGVLTVALLGWLVTDREARRAWRRPGPWLALLVAALVSWPHFRWAAAHDWTTLRYAEARSAGAANLLQRLTFPLGFAGGQALALLPLLIVVGCLRCQRGRAEWSVPLRAGRFLAAAVAGPAGLLVLLSAVGGRGLRFMWGAPLWTFAPLALLAVVRPRIDAAAARRVALTCLCFLLLAALALAGRNLAGPWVTRQPERVHFNGPQLARAAAAAWATVSDQPLPIVAGPWWLAGNISLYLPGHPSVYASCDHRLSDWLDDETVRRRGAVLVWYLEPMSRRARAEQAPGEAEAWLARFPHAIRQPDLAMTYRTLGPALPPLRLGLAVIPPGGER